VIKESLKDGHKIYKFEFCEIVDNCNFDDVFVRSECKCSKNI
ncbi:TPA: DUF1132 family protein, partial [Neisseria meningitidis]